MSGEYDPNNPPERAGFYATLKALASAEVVSGDLGIVAMPIQHNWGPEGEAVSIKSEKDFDDNFGTTDSDDRFAVLGALKGDDENGGASEVLCYRHDLDDSVKATVTLDNTGAANAITLTAKHPGTHGNAISVTVDDDPVVAGSDRLRLYVDGVLRETFVYAQADIQALVDAINAATTGSVFVDATLDADGTALAAIVSEDLTTGANGTLEAADHDVSQAALENEEWHILTVPNMTNAAIRASYLAWIEDLNTTSKRAMFVMGGSAAETLQNGIDRAAEANDQINVANVILDFVDPDGTTKSSAQMTGHIAGMIAGAGVQQNITFNRLDGYDIAASISHADIVSAIEGGCIVFSRDASGIKLEREVNTYTDDTVDRPYETFRSIRTVRITHKIETDLTKTTEQEWIGRVQNTPSTRADYRGMVLGYLRDLEGLNVLEKGTSEVTFDPAEDNTGNTLYPRFTIDIQGVIEFVLAVGEIK